jgi:preprotein translocase subunit SecD
VYGITEPQAKQIKADAVSHAIELLRNRVDKFGVTEPLIQKVGAERILLQMPGVSDIDAVKKVVGSVGKLEFRLVARGASAEGQVSFKTREGGTTMLEDEVALGGDAVEKAAVGFGDRGVHVELTLNSDGAKTFRKVTSENVGRQLAIILDGVVFSAPEIQTAIPDGHAQITGRYTPEEARQLAVVLREALPAPLKVLEERTVGPTLGLASIKSGVMAVLVGFAAIILFMIAYYKKSGVVAVISLSLNMVLMVAALSAFGATLTLPGIAGLALTIGMAVDANIIIFERIKEEIQNGSSRDAAVAAGFEKALSAILDSNITTLLAAAILYYFGTGSIRGFAVTLSIGIATTVYAATFGSRFMFDALPLRGSKGLSI